MNDQTNRINHPQLTGNNPVIPVCAAYSTAGAAINGLADVGIDLRHLNVLGKGHQTHEKRGMSYNTDDCTKSVGGWRGVSGVFYPYAIEELYADPPRHANS